MDDDPGSLVALTFLGYEGGLIDNIILISSLLVVTVTVAASTALRNFRWPRLERLVPSGSRLERIETIVDDEREILDGLLVLHILGTIALLFSLIGYWSGDRAEGALDILEDIGLALLVFLGFVHGVVRGLVRAVPERTLIILLGPARFLASAVSPLVWLMDGIGRVLARAFGLQMVEDEHEEAREDILDAVSEGEREGAIADEAREMIENIIEVRDQAVSQVMTPRTSVFGLPAGTSLDEAVPQIVERGHSRIPVFEDTIDNIKGVLYAKDVLAHWNARNGTESPAVRELMRPALFIPETKKTSELLDQLRRVKVHMAIVVDEYGGTAGLITIEDIIEEIVGDIEDEYDIPLDGGKPLLTMVAEREAEVSARVSIDELNDALDLELPQGDGYDTVGGFLFHQMGRVPETGESCQVDKIHFEIMEADERRIHLVKVKVEG